ncbi:uncharacterized protein EI97DRAFT_453517 [Westerdykella ornata]|uniref:F-box domain-containing protein n=1 Tax=Westerdykella ornata TaxID=318751 RepID=A0A6A6J694_WESOR|nr:uncharacterized protein EI97DRAFT_453517 [Westerdykella ornata]KAF2271717.1 hypothetical protein EI97DRAFT_453517 [Westerdykella ornata]
MALSRPRRPVKPISYKESSSDEGSSDDSDTNSSRINKNQPTRKSTARSSNPKQPSLRQTRHAVSSQGLGTTVAPSTRQLRTKRKRSYRESSTENDEDSEKEVISKRSDRRSPSTSSYRPLPQRASKRRKMILERDESPEDEIIRPPHSRDEPMARMLSSSPRDKNLLAMHSEVLAGPHQWHPYNEALHKSLNGQSSQANHSQVTRSSTQPSSAMNGDREIPDWLRLDYDIVVDILTYAAEPLLDENSAPTSSVAWLARTALVCRTWSKPALTALYRVPPILDKRCRPNARLIQRLTDPQTDTWMNYAHQVRRLEIDRTRISPLSAYLSPLVSSLRAVKEIDFFDPSDRPPYREGKARMRRWFYPDTLFTAMEQAEMRLRSWSWNSTYCARGPLWMKDVHGNRAMRTLRDITLRKFQADERPPGNSELEDKNSRTEELIASSLAVLPYLESITFESCTAVNARLLPLLPDSLVNLKIVNCGALNSQALEAYLISHGRHLKTLTLNHNQMLDLDWLVGLKIWAPCLEVLQVDTHFYNTLATSTSNEPLYDELLTVGAVPTWPSTLRILDMQFLRNWSPVAAVAFFQSLIDSAPDLPHLQELTITAIVDTEWRERAEFRKKWTHAFEKVFKRKWEPPSPHLVSLDAYSQWKESQQDPFRDNAVDVRGHDSLTTSSDEHSTAASRTATRSERWSSKRLRNRTRRSPGRYTETDSSSEHTSDEPDKEDAEPLIKFVQGKCHKVEFKIDNSRPQEQIFDEEDFLDDDNSEEDEEWNGVDEEEDEGLAW